MALSLGSYGSWPFERLGQLADVGGDYETAEVFLAAAVEVSPDPAPVLDLVYERSVLGRCDDAVGALADPAGKGGSRDDLSLAAEWVLWCHQQ